MKESKAVFVDRDGVLNDLVYDDEEGRVGSPFSARELRVFPYVAGAVKRIKDELGFKVIVISNQPGVAKKQFTLAELERMNAKVRRELARVGTSFDGEYYCLHHPNALLGKYRVVCECRKPKPGMLITAAKENGVDLEKSFFVGDALVDVKAGARARCQTILVGQLTSFLARLMEQQEAAPNYVLPSLKEVPAFLASIAPGDGSIGKTPSSHYRN